VKRHLTVSLAVTMTIGPLAIPMRAASKPRAGMEDQKRVWTNDDLERLRVMGLVSIIGQPATAEDTTTPRLPSSYANTQDPAWYAERATKLNDELERRQAQLREYRQALEDAQSLKEMTSGINLDEGNVGITPEAGMEILEQRVNQTQMELDTLEDLARRNDIPPGALRGQ
jgi:hypothetical protein